MNPSWYQRPWSAVKGEVASVPVGMIAFYFVVSRLLIVLLTVLSLKVITQGHFGISAHLLDTYARWDSGWYTDIAAYGYNFGANHQSNTGFFPLYPMAIHLVGFAIHDLRIAGYLVSNTCLFASCLVLWKLVARDYSSKAAADRAVIFVLLGPVSFFFSIIYSEGLFFLLFVLVAYFASGRRWITAGVCGYLLTLSRTVGIFAVFLLAAEFAGVLVERSRELGWREGIRSGVRSSGLPFVLSELLTMSGLGSYCLYLWIKFGHPLAFVEAQQSGWGRHLSLPWKFFHHDLGFHYSFYSLWFEGTIWLGFTLFAVGLVLRIRPSHSVITILCLVFYLSTNLLDAVPRYLSVLFPFYITLALVAVRWPRLEPMLLAGSTMLLALSTILFVDGYWFT